jgi:serine protease Do
VLAAILVAPLVTLVTCFGGTPQGAAMAQADGATGSASAPLATGKAMVSGLPSFAPLAQALTPSVVNVSTTQVIQPKLPPGHPGFGPFWRFFGEPQQQGPQTVQSLGSGYVIDTEGHIVTNNHVVAHADKIFVTFVGDDHNYEAKVVGTDKLTDIAVIKVLHPPKDLHPVTFGDSSKIQVGDWVLAIGNPFGLNSTVTAGIISAKGRHLGSSSYEDFLQTDASINPGNSGGPLVDLEGQVIGMNSAIYSRSGGNIGIGFAIPSNIIQRIVPQLEKHGKVTRGWLGVYIQKVTDDMASALGLKAPQGALIAQVVDNGPAAKAGIKSGDVILDWNGKPVKTSDDLPFLVAQTRPGAKAKVTVLRDGKKKTLSVTVEALPANGKASAKTGGNGDLGLSVQKVTPDLAQQLGLPHARGVVVTAVTPGSAADQAGLTQGDVIVQVGGHEIRTVSDYRAAIRKVKKGKTVLIRAWRGGHTLFFALRP